MGQESRQDRSEGRAVQAGRLPQARARALRRAGNKRAFCLRWLRWVAVAGSCGLTSGFALAQQGSSADGVAAEALYGQANALMAEGRFDEACAKYRASNDLDVGVGTLLRLGNCYEQASRFSSAQLAFAEAQQLANEQGDSARAHLAEVRSSALRPRVPRLQLRVDPAALQLPGFHVFLDGQLLPLEDLDEPVELDQGKHIVEARAPGRQTVAQTFAVRNDAAEAFVVPVGGPGEALDTGRTEAESPRALAAEDAGGSTRLRKMSWIVGGTGAAALLGSGLVALLASDKNSSADSECDPNEPGSCNRRGAALREDARSMANVALALGIAGAVTLGGGVTMYFLAPSPQSKGRRRARAGGFGLQLEGRF